MRGTFNDDDPRHGTYAGAQQHRYRGTEKCEPCREAYAAYHREHRKSDERYLHSGRRTNKARGRALTLLRALYPDEYERLYAQELGRLRGLS